MVGGSERGWYEIGKGWNETREGEKGNRGGGEEECMNYPYIISTLFVLVWVDDG